MNKTIKQDQALMSILKVHEISRIICETNMGVLKLQIRKGESEYRFLLDSVPLPKELHKEVYELLYAPEIPQVKQQPNFIDPVVAIDKSIFKQVVDEHLKKSPKWDGEINGEIVDKQAFDKAYPKPKGRPKGSVNKKNESTKA